MMRQMVVLVALFIASFQTLALTGCRPATGGKADSHTLFSAPTPDPCATRQRVVIGIDATGSYANQKLAVTQIDQIIHRDTCPGDEIIVRKIEADSYQPAAALFSAVLPLVGAPPPTPDILYNRGPYNRALSTWQIQLQAFGVAQLQIGDAVLKLSLGEAPKSDLVGFFAKAGELLAAAPPGYVKHIIAATDMRDNVGRDAQLDLKGVDILIIGFEGDDPITHFALRQEWGKRLRDAGAVNVRFIDPTDPSPPSLTPSSTSLNVNVLPTFSTPPILAERSR